MTACIDIQTYIEEKKHTRLCVCAAVSTLHARRRRQSQSQSQRRQKQPEANVRSVFSNVASITIRLLLVYCLATSGFRFALAIASRLDRVLLLLSCSCTRCAPLRTISLTCTKSRVHTRRNFADLCRHLTSLQHTFVLRYKLNLLTIYSRNISATSISR